MKNGICTGIGKAEQDGKGYAGNAWLFYLF